MIHILIQIIFIIGIASFVACEQVVNLDINQAPPRLVIDGLVTSDDTTHFVRITRTADFYGNGGENVNDAIVQVSDEIGNIYNYTHNPEGYDSLNGYYYSDQQYSGRVYGIYNLEVTVGGDNFMASDTLKPITTIDSLQIQVDPRAVDDPENDGKIYQVLLFAREPQETVDFYYFKFYRDGLLDANDNIFVFDDKLLGESLNGLPSPVLFREGELASVVIYSLSRDQFVYFQDLGNILNGDGGMFSPPPANPRSNISGGALGLFQVSGISRGSILITP
jgi:hypothetical protein